MGKNKSYHVSQPTERAEELSRPIRSLVWLSLFTEIAILLTLPAALVMSVLELSSGGESLQVVRFWTAFIIGIAPFHIFAVDRLLRRPRRNAPPALRASQFFAGIFVAAMLAFTIVVVVSPLLEMLNQLTQGNSVSAGQIVTYLAIMIFFQLVLWMAWLATPQLNVAAGEQRLMGRLNTRRENAS